MVARSLNILSRSTQEGIAGNYTPGGQQWVVICGKQGGYLGVMHRLSGSVIFTDLCSPNHRELYMRVFWTHKDQELLIYLLTSTESACSSHLDNQGENGPTICILKGMWDCFGK